MRFIVRTRCGRGSPRSWSHEAKPDHPGIEGLGQAPPQSQDMRGVLIGALAILLAALACVSVWPRWHDPVRWTPDALYYQARLLEFRGESEPEAIGHTFGASLSAGLRARAPAHTGNPAWVKYNEPFYERRAAVPLAGAAIYPLTGERSLLYISLGGYIAAVLAL